MCFFFACKRKLIKIRLADGLKVITQYLALSRPEKQLSMSTQLKMSRIKVTDVNQLPIGTCSTSRRCVMSVRMLQSCNAILKSSILTEPYWL